MFYRAQTSPAASAVVHFLVCIGGSRPVEELSQETDKSRIKP